MNTTILAAIAGLTLVTSATTAVADDDLDAASAELGFESYAPIVDVIDACNEEDVFEAIMKRIDQCTPLMGSIEDNRYRGESAVDAYCADAAFDAVAEFLVMTDGFSCELAGWGRGESPLSIGYSENWLELIDATPQFQLRLQMATNGVLFDYGMVRISVYADESICR